ncbi:MAG: hypothetical protein CVU38_20015 [Chloroflexi bacterium HGW-Chloroflexi-1]|nr:MAG: hypothetical protein CVU38_20015 [Chloroflexi bacterium HGW-Chloroflexi-1]
MSADELDAQSGGDRNAVELLGRLITPEIVRQVIRKASAVNWGAHLLRWRYFDVTHAGRVYHRGTLVPTALWHLLKRICVDQDWPADTTLDQLNADARATIQADDTEIWCYGYYRTDPPRLQWGFFRSSLGIAVVYDDEADLIATVFKPVEGTRFFAGQLSAYRVDRQEWAI